MSHESTDAEKANSTEGDASTRRLVTLTAGAAILGAIVLGYLVGRKRD